MLLQNCPDAQTRNTFTNKKIILRNSQPPNILRLLTSAKFDSITIEKKKWHIQVQRKEMQIIYIVYGEMSIF